MQTSGSSSSTSGSVRAAGLAGAIGLAILISGGWLGCSPGEPDCEALGTLCKAGAGGESTGGTGGVPAVRVARPPRAMSRGLPS